MLFFRIELRHKGPCGEGFNVKKGVYLSSLSDKLVRFEPNIHPIPSQDGIEFEDGWNSDYVFGFSSMKQLNTWFDDIPSRKLNNDVGCIGVYESDDYILGNRQAIFNGKTCKLIDVIDLSRKTYRKSAWETLLQESYTTRLAKLFSGGTTPDTNQT